LIYGGRRVEKSRIAECIECGRLSGFLWTRWRAYRVDDPEAEGPPELAFYCPACALREFGPPRRRPLEDRRMNPRPEPFSDEA
jgi:hypothetical protein